MNQPLRYSLRDICWLTLVCALVLGWYCDHKRTNAQMVKERMTNATRVATSFTSGMKAGIKEMQHKWLAIERTIYGKPDKLEGSDLQESPSGEEFKD
jgi:hypothetical protein